MSQAASQAQQALIEVEHADLGYGTTRILSDVSLQVARGDFLAVVGPNGAGKTTLLRSILGILPPLRGTVRQEGRLGYSPQRSVLDPVYPFTALEVVAMGLEGRRWIGWGDRQAELAKAERALEDCGLHHRRHQLFRDLSGGQKQRALVARALVSDPEVLILDEPTNDLDLRGEHEVMEVVRDLHAEHGRTVIMVSHMLHVVARYAERLAFVNHGKMVAGEAGAMLVPEQLQELYDMPVAVGAFSGGYVGVAPAESPRPRAGNAREAPAQSAAAKPAAPSPSAKPALGARKKTKKKGGKASA